MSTFVVGKEEFKDSVDAAMAMLNHDKADDMAAELFNWKCLELPEGQMFKWLASEFNADPEPCWTYAAILDEMATDCHESILLGDDPDSMVGVLADDWYEEYAETAEALGSPDAEPMTIEVTVKITI